MPFAIGVAASWSKYLEVPTKYKTMFYWWTPDNAFLEMQPSKLVLPPFNAYAWSQADYTTAASAVPVAKIATKDLQAMAPDISKLLEASLFDLEAVDSMMLNMKSNSVTREQAACDWLKANTDRWKSWIPKATQCNPGFGLYDDATDTFTAERATATTCRACLPGMFSKALGEGSILGQGDLWKRRQKKTARCMGKTVVEQEVIPAELGRSTIIFLGLFDVSCWIEGVGLTWAGWLGNRVVIACSNQKISQQW